MEITATDWLEMEFIKLEKTIGVNHKMYELLEQAKEIEKQNLINFYVEGCESTYGEDGPSPNTSESEYGEAYYNHQFKNK